MTDEKPDYATLRWVKEGIDETLMLARQALEKYGESDYDSQAIEDFVIHVHQLSGTLRMVQVYGAGMLVEEMERIANMLLQGELQGNAQVAESLMLGLVQLPQYLDRLEKGEPDIPLVLLPVLNDLRAYRDMGPASEVVLYAPNLDRLIEREPIIPGSGNPSIPDIVHKLRLRYHKALLLTYRDENLEEGLQQILKIVQELNAVAGTLRLRRLMDAAEALVISLLEGEFSADQEVKPLFSRIDRVFKDLIDKGEEETVRDFPMDLLKSLLYFVSRSHSRSAIVETVKRTADLANSFPDQIHKPSSELVLGADDSVHKAVTRVLLEDLAAVKEKVDLYIRGDHSDTRRLQGLDVRLGKVADTLGMMGRGFLREELVRAVDLLEDINGNAVVPNPDQLMDIATVIVSVESALGVIDEDGSGTTRMSAQELRDQAVSKDVAEAVRQASNEFSRVKEVVEKFIRGQADLSRLRDASNDLGKLVNVFQVVDMGDVSAILTDVNQVLLKLESGEKTLSLAQQGALVDVLAGVDYYFEAFLEGRQNIEQYLDYARNAAHQLVIHKDVVEHEVYPEVEEIQNGDDATAVSGGLNNAALTLDEAKAEQDEFGATADSDDPDNQVVQEAIEELGVDSLQPSDLEDESTEGYKIAAETVEESVDSDQQGQQESIQVEDAGQDIPDVVFPQMDVIDPEIFDIFMEEAEDELLVIQEQYPVWKHNPANEEPLQTFRRSFHTLKGSGRMVGAEVIGEFAWSVENLLNRVIEGSVPVSQQLFDFMDRVVEAVPVLIKAQAQGGVAEVDVKGLEKQAFALAGNELEVDIIDVQKMAQADQADAEALQPEKADTDDEVLLEGDAHTPSSLLLADDLSEIFKAESMTHLDVVSRFIESCSDCEIDDGVLRAIHTLHGSAHLAEVEPMAALAGTMEALCKHLSRLSFTCDEAVLAVFRKFHDKTIEIVDSINVPDAELNGLDALIDEIRRLDASLPEVISELQPGQDSELIGVTESDQELAGIFLEEAGEIMQQLVDSLMEWESSGSHVSAQSVATSLYQLKGSARLAGFTPLADLLHGLQSFFDALTEAAGEADQNTRKRVMNLFDEVENAMDNLHLNGKLPDLIGQIQDANILAQEMQQLTAATGPVEEVIEAVEDGHYEEPESILFSETWKAEHEAGESPQFDDSSQSEKQPQLTAVDVDPELLEIFLEEAGELGEQLEEHLEKWQEDIQSKEAVDGLMRNLHTLKGNARFAGLFGLGDLSHALESLFEKLAAREIAPDPELVPLVRQGMDGLETAIEQLQRNNLIPDLKGITQALEAAAAGEDWRLLDAELVVSSMLVDESSSMLVDESSALTDTRDSSFIADSQLLTDSELVADSELRDTGGKVVPFPVEEVKSRPQKRPPPLQAEAEQAGKGERVRVLAELLDQLVNNAGEVSIYRARLEQQNKIMQANLEELNETIVRLRGQLRALELETEAHVLSRYEREAEERQYEDFDPLEMDRYSTLQQLSRALSETISDLSNIGDTLGEQTRDADTLLLQQERVTTDLQDGLLRSRMVPFKRQASRLQRVVRQTAQNLGKKAELDVVGADGEIDRTILNRIMGPLEHLLRNAVAHGIEPPEIRKKREKPQVGKVTLTLAREGTEVVLTIADDGAGLDADAIRKKAVASGMLEKDAVITEDALYQFILQPGFSTATEVTQVAGRGVGMDAVVSEIKQLGGSLEILSQRERGSSFVIRLPFTLAISEALLVTVGEEVFAIPHGSAEVIIRAKREDLQACYKGESEGIQYNGHLYKVRYLGSLLGIAEPTISESVKWYPLLLVRAGEQRMAIQMDNLLGNYQIVVKSIGAILSSVRWFTGGTILADGKIALLLDVNSVVRSDGMVQMPVAPVQEEETKGISVMVVDDSVTVRKVTSRLLERHNMNVLTARDGVDAITVLQDNKPDVMLLDIEMPRMDGYELARHIRNTPELADIPIIMITSRTGEKHRQRAFDLGVNRYLGKPYQEVDLLENIYALLGDQHE